MSQAGSNVNTGSGSGLIRFLQGDNGGPVGPNAAQTIFVVGGNNITVSGNPFTFTETIAVTGNTNHSVLLGNATGSINSLVNGTTGQILTAVTGLDPVWAAPAASVTSITGNSGPAQTGAINLITANATPTFVGAAGTITLDFNKSNLILGNNGSGITIGAANDGFGSGVLQSITSGSSNSAFGNASLQNVIGGSQNSAFGASAGTALNTGGNNTLIGFQSGLLLQSGNSNVSLGYQSGSAWGSAVSNNIALGSIGAVADSARIRIGTNGVHTTAFFAGIDGVNVGSVAKVLTMASDQLGTATITAGAGITVTPAANLITIAATGMGSFTWSVITANQTAAVNNGYFCNKAGTLALLLPAISAVGDTIEVSNINAATGIQFTQAAGQQIFIANTSTTLGATGTLTSSLVGDALTLVCSAANTTWRVISMVGSWTPA